jgi:uncharacterized protein (TIGR03067 family)
MLRHLLVVLLPFLAIVADAAPDTVKKELEKFRGSWRYGSMEMEGTAMPQESLKDAKLVCDGDHFTFSEPGMTHRGTFRIDPTKAPKTIDVVFTEGPNKGETLLGIYELEGDTYRVCLATPGKERPKALVSKANSGTVLEVLKRDKP